MQKKLTITIDEKVYAALHEVVGTGKISRFIESLVRPYVLEGYLTEGYKAMAENDPRENEAHLWSEETLKDLPS